MRFGARRLKSHHKTARLNFIDMETLPILRQQDSKGFSFELTFEANKMKGLALERSAAVGRVASPEENDIAVAALTDLRAVDKWLEDARVEATKPILQAQRTLKAAVDAHRNELGQEQVRLSRLVGDYQAGLLAQQRAAEAAQRKELEAQERKRQEELAKANTIDAQIAVNEKFDRQAAEVKEVAPIPEPVRAKGQVVAEKWVIERLNESELGQKRPDLVRKYEFAMDRVYAELERGVKLPGVVASKQVVSSVRLGRTQPAIDV